MMRCRLHFRLSLFDVCTESRKNGRRLCVLPAGGCKEVEGRRLVQIILLLSRSELLPRKTLHVTWISDEAGDDSKYYFNDNIVDHNPNLLSS